MCTRAKLDVDAGITPTSHQQPAINKARLTGHTMLFLFRTQEVNLVEVPQQWLKNATNTPGSAKRDCLDHGESEMSIGGGPPQTDRRCGVGG
jgi:hypothetical protein